MEKKKVKISDLVLGALNKVADGYMYLDEIYHHPGSVWYDRFYFKNQSSLRSAVARLKNRGLVKSDVRQGRVILRLSNAGRDWVLKKSDQDESSWDGIWRLVIFDIPESHRKVRQTLRNKLKSWGFVLWQKSVWAGKQNLTQELRKLVLELGVNDWVLVIESKNTGR